MPSEREWPHDLEVRLREVSRLLRSLRDQRTAADLHDRMGVGVAINVLNGRARELRDELRREAERG